MRLHELYIDEFKNLRELQIDFHETSLSTVIVGQNGTGKSNVIEALVLIFRHLDLNEKAPFRYRILYECRGRTVEADATSGITRFRTGESRESLANLTKEEFKRIEGGRRIYLPAHVFGYYSGPSNRLEEHFETHHNRFYRDLLAGKAEAHLRPLFYARAVHSQFVLLAFFSGLGEPQGKFLRRYLGIHDLDSVLFVLNEPTWGKSQKKYRDYGWYWHARGAVRDFLDRLHQQSLAPLKLRKQRVPLGLASSEQRDHLFLFLPNIESLRELAEAYGNQREFFAALESTYISDLIREVRVRVKIGGEGKPLSFRELSEGEQQLLMVLGLLKFTQQEEALFLLDEPDTHLNPAWSVEYLDLLKEVVGEGRRSHFIIATHDPLVIAGLVKDQVQILERGEDGAIRAVQPLDDPRGMGVSALLTSEIYGLRSELDPYTLKKVDRKRDLSLKDELTEKEIEELGEINEYLQDKDFIDSDRDPAFSSWTELLNLIEKDLGVEGMGLSPAQLRDLRARIKLMQNEVLKGVR